MTDGKSPIDKELENCRRIRRRVHATQYEADDQGEWRRSCFDYGDRALLGLYRSPSRYRSLEGISTRAAVTPATRCMA